jgi:hypothetical protein
MKLNDEIMQKTGPVLRNGRVGKSVMKHMEECFNGQLLPD